VTGTPTDVVGMVVAIILTPINVLVIAYVTYAATTGRLAQAMDSFWYPLRNTLARVLGEQQYSRPHRGPRPDRDRLRQLEAELIPKED